MEKVGILGFFNLKLIAYSVDLKEGVDDGLFINGPFDHVNQWNITKKSHPKLSTFEYEEIPRGRVLYNKNEKRFSVYMDKVLFKEKQTKDIITAEFQLPISKTKFMTDSHYTTCKKGIEKLLED